MIPKTDRNYLRTRIAFILLPLLIAASFSACKTNDQARRFSAADQGEFVAELPRRYKAVSIDGIVYYHSRGNYFQKRGTGYAKVQAPPSTLRSKRAISYRSLYNESAERRKLVRVR